MILACPERTVLQKSVRDWNSLTISNIGYFICLSATATNGSSILSGDSGFLVNGQTRSGTVSVSSKDHFDYPSDLHENRNSRLPNIAFSDGSAHNFQPNKWASVLNGTGAATNLFLTP